MADGWILLWTLMLRMVRMDYKYYYTVKCACILTSHSIVRESLTEFIANNEEDGIRKSLACEKLLWETHNWTHCVYLTTYTYIVQKNRIHLHIILSDMWMKWNISLCVCVCVCVCVRVCVCLCVCARACMCAYSTLHNKHVHNITTKLNMNVL